MPSPSIVHIRLRGPRRTGHFSSSGYYYKGSLGPRDNDPRGKTHCGAEPTCYDLAWRQRNAKYIDAGFTLETTTTTVCRDCVRLARA